MEQASFPPTRANRDPVRLRRFTAADIPAMHALDRSCFRKGISYTLEELQYFTRHPCSFSLIAETGAQPVAGFFIAERTVHHGQIAGHIITIDVHPECRRQGIGRTLMEAMEQQLRKYGARCCVLEVAVDDPGAQEFYSRLGYRAVSRLRGYYMDTLDAIVMEKDFPLEDPKAA